MPSDPPAAPLDFATTLVTRQLGMALPAECAAGVEANLALLSDHWANLRGAECMDDPA